MGIKYGNSKKYQISRVTRGQVFHVEEDPDSSLGLAGHSASRLDCGRHRVMGFLGSNVVLFDENKGAFLEVDAEKLMRHARVGCLRFQPLSETARG